MKKFKLLGVAIAAIIGIGSASAQDYNRIGISYNNNHFGFNRWLKYGAFDGLVDGISLNGAGFSYIHGFSLSQSAPIFIETGASLNFGAGSWDSGTIYMEDYETGYLSKGSIKLKARNFNLQVPVNFVYRFAATDDFKISPFAGLNFKLNIMTGLKAEASAGGYSVDTDWYDLFNGDDMEEAFGDDATGNRFQMGWHVGVGFQYKPAYLSVSYGTDFIAAYSHRFYGKAAKISTGNLTVTLGYTF